MGALDEETERPTPLGAALAALPTDPAAGRALLAGAAWAWAGRRRALAAAGAARPARRGREARPREDERRVGRVRAAAEKAPCADGRALRDVSREAQRPALAARAARRAATARTGESRRRACRRGAVGRRPAAPARRGGRRARPRLAFVDEAGAVRAAKPHPSGGFAAFKSGALLAANGGLVRRRRAPPGGGRAG